jgi:putative transposase
MNMSYPTDLTDSQWELIKEFFDTGNYGKSRKHSRRVLVDAVLYVIKTGCQWRFLPKDYPPWETVYSFYRRARDKAVWEKMMKALVEKDRIRMGRNPNPSYSLIDSQSVKTTSSGRDRGIDGGKKDKR